MFCTDILHVRENATQWRNKGIVLKFFLWVNTCQVFTRLDFQDKLTIIMRDTSILIIHLLQCTITAKEMSVYHFRVYQQVDAQHTPSCSISVNGHILKEIHYTILNQWLVLCLIVEEAGNETKIISYLKTLIPIRTQQCRMEFCFCLRNNDRCIMVWRELPNK